MAREIVKFQRQLLKTTLGNDTERRFSAVVSHRKFPGSRFSGFTFRPAPDARVPCRRVGARPARGLAATPCAGDAPFKAGSHDQRRRSGLCFRTSLDGIDGSATVK